MTRLILASRSPARAKMLRDAGLDVEVRPSPLNEAAAKTALASTGLSAEALAVELAAAKALALAADTSAWVLGADQTLDLDGEVLDKPGDMVGLDHQLGKLQGRRHHLHSAAALVRDGQVAWRGCTSVHLEMRALSLDERRRYIETEGENVLGCVGGYRLEGPGVRLFSSVEGEYFAVLGLPMLSLLAGLRDLGLTA